MDFQNRLLYWESIVVFRRRIGQCLHKTIFFKTAPSNQCFYNWLGVQWHMFCCENWLIACEKCVNIGDRLMFSRSFQIVHFVWMSVSFGFNSFFIEKFSFTSLTFLNIGFLFYQAFSTQKPQSKTLSLEVHTQKANVCAPNYRLKLMRLYWSHDRDIHRVFCENKEQGFWQLFLSFSVTELTFFVVLIIEGFEFNLWIKWRDFMETIKWEKLKLLWNFHFLSCF